MANSKWDLSQYKVIYSPDGDDVDTLTQRYLSLLPDLETILRLLLGGHFGPSEPEEKFPFMVWIRSDTTPPQVKFRNAANDAWIQVFELDAFCGIRPNDIDGIEGFSIKAIHCGNDIDRTLDKDAGRLYLAVDSGVLYFDVGNGYEEILKKNHTHFAIGDKQIVLNDIKDGEVLAFNNSTQRFEPRSNGGSDLTNEKIQQLMTQISQLDMGRVNNRLNAVERAVSNMALEMEGHSLMPEASTMIVEDFENPDQIDQVKVKITSLVVS